MQVVFADPISALQYVSGGTLVALAVTSKERSPVAPSVPTISESGYPGFHAIAWHGILAPANTPPAIIRKLNAEIVAALQDPETKALLRETCRPSAIRRRRLRVSSRRISRSGRKWRIRPRSR